MKLIKSYYILFFLCLSFFLRAQRAPVVAGDLISQLEFSVRSGQKKSLRDLGSLLDKKEESKQALDILQRYTMFTTEEIDLSKSPSKSEFLKFYYDNETDFQFSELTGNFYLSPLEERKIKTKIESVDILNADKALSLFHKAEESIIEAIQKRMEGKLRKQINFLGKLDLPEAKLFLLDLSDQLRETPDKPWSPAVYQSLSSALVYTSDIRSLESILGLLLENRIETKTALSHLAMVSNISLPEATKKRAAIQQYQYIIDSLGTLDNIRMYGYEKLFDFRPAFFENIADYFGRVLCFANGREWLVHNAINDLIKTTHPRALFYMAAVGFKNEYHYPDISYQFSPAVSGIQKLTLFRRLNSRNDSVAMASFKQLTEGDPAEIIALANKYRQMFRSYNQTLPPFKYKYLEQLAELTLFCRRYEISYEPNKKLSGLLRELSLASDQPERYSLENKIIKHLSKDDITPLEYWACVHQENKENNFSVGRILDIYYSKHWDEILKDNLQLRLFLKKADLFKNIGVIGVCNTYLNKFDLNQTGLEERLKLIQKEETDEQILNQIAQLAAFNESEEANAFSDFIADPLYFDKRDIKILPPPTLDELKQVIQMIQEETENGIIGKLYFYLRLHPTIESVPQLMELAANDRIIAQKRGKTVTLGDQVTPILESIFNYNYPMTATDKIFDIRPWLEKWGADQANYLKWPKRFFEEKMTFLEEQEELGIDDINLITESQNYDNSYKEFILKSLQKVKPTKDIRSLSIEPKLSIATDLQYFEAFEFSYKELDDIPKLFELNEPATLLKFLIQRADLYDMEKKGSFYNNMFRHAWFSTYLNSGDADLVTVAYIQQTLETYLDESEYMSEYEEQITTLHVAQLQNIGKPLEERLLAPFDLNADIAAKAKIQETIISTVSYADKGKNLGPFYIVTSVFLFLI